MDDESDHRKTALGGQRHAGGRALPLGRVEHLEAIELAALMHGGGTLILAGVGENLLDLARGGRGRARAEVDPDQPAPTICDEGGWCRFADFTCSGGKLGEITSDRSNVWMIVGDDRVARLQRRRRDINNRLTCWELEDSNLNDIWAHNNVAVAVGSSGFAARFESNEWTKLSTGVTQKFTDVDGLLL